MTDPTPARSSSFFGRRFGCCLALGFVATVIVLFVARLGQNGSYVALGPEVFQEAQARWDSQSVPDYDIEITVTGRQASRYRVEIRSGDPVAAFRDGQPLNQRRTWSTWTVPGMFGTVEADLNQLQRVARGEPGIPGLSVLVEFDGKYGFPKRYLRVESMRRAANPEVSWEVTLFQPQVTAKSDN